MCFSACINFAAFCGKFVLVCILIYVGNKIHTHVSLYDNTEVIILRVLLDIFYAYVFAMDKQSRRH